VDPATAIMGGSSIIGAGSSLIGGSNASDAAENAANAQLQGVASSNALQRYMYNTSRADQAPWRQMGGNAVNMIGLLLGIPGAGPKTADTFDEAAYLKAHPEVAGMIGDSGGSATPVAPAHTGYYNFGNTEGESGGSPVPIAAAGGQKYASAFDHWQKTGNAGTFTYKPGTSAGPAAQNANYLTNTLRNTPGYKFQQEEGMNALERSAAASGRLNSGATMKGITRFSQGLADSTYENFMNRLYSLAGLGQSSANSTQAAGTNFANQAGANAIAGGNARGSGYINSANAWNGAMQGVGSSINSGVNNYMFYNMMNNRGGGSSYSAPTFTNPFNGTSY